MQPDFAELAAELQRKAEESCTAITKGADRAAVAAKQQICDWLDRQLAQVRGLADLAKHGGLADLLGKAKLTTLQEIELKSEHAEPHVPYSARIDMEIKTGGYNVLVRDTIGQLDAGKYRMLVLFIPKE